jgi:hypothetical protein
VSLRTFNQNRQAGIQKSLPVINNGIKKYLSGCKSSGLDFYAIIVKLPVLTGSHDPERLL